MQIDFLGMQAFLAVVEQGGFHAAARHLHLSPTAVSHRLRKLEDSLGVKLLARTTRRATLTEAGRTLLPAAREAVLGLHHACEMLRHQSRTAPQWLAVGCLPTLAPQRLAPALQTFALHYPDTAIRVFDDTVNELAQYVESGAATFAISIAGAKHPFLQQRIFAHENFVVACSTRHPYANNTHLCWADLKSENLIRISLPAGNAATIDDALGANRASFRWHYEVQHTQLALDLVAAGLGLTVVPALSIGNFPGVIAKPLSGPTVTRTLILLTHPTRQLSPEAEMLCNLLMDEIRRQLLNLEY